MNARKPVQPDHLKGVRLLNDNMIVELFPEKEIGGIIIPDMAKEQTQRARILQVGPGRIKEEKNGKVISRNKMSVKVGDVVLLVKYAGSEVSIEQEKHLLLKGEDDILGIYNGNSPVDIVPLGTRVFIEWEFAEDTFKGSNLVRAPGTLIERHYTGTVIAVGPECSPQTIDLIGKRIFFWQFCGPERVNHEGKRFAFMYESDIIAQIPTRKEMEVLSE